ncbi:hypothetical protein ACFMQL_35030 [Nonomuraea fastidiosa]|jgi:hypothetical protein|uniref:hypothetical protein n=1 Tax=Nonomuraea fastidiosa TaxID=46173 RepID=UPI00366BA75B
MTRDTVMHEIDRLVAGIAPDPGPGMTPISRELLEEVTSIPVAESRRGRLTSRIRRWAAVPALAALTVLMSFGVAQAPASAALDIKVVDGHYVITVKDLMAEPEVYERELRARGINITLKLVPTSASMTGQIFVLNDVDRLRAGETVPAQGPIRAIDRPGPCERFGGCPIGLKVPVGYTKKAGVILGRRAAPGERYGMPPGIAMPGEPLHCVDYVNRTVAEVAALLRERGVTPSYTAYGRPRGFTPPDGWYVLDGVMSADHQALLLVADKPGKPSDYNGPGEPGVRRPQKGC